MNRLFFLVLLLLPVLGYSQIPTTGLVGAWPFSGNANDVSGSANHGTVTGAALVPDRCGIANSAYNFNGSSDYIQMLTTGPTGTLSRSVSFWVKTTNTTSNAPVSSFDYGTATGAGDSFQIVWNYCSQGVGLDVSNQALIRGNICLENGAWHHVVAVMNATASTSYSAVAYYIDGVLQTAISCNVSGLNASVNTGVTSPITIGRGATSATRYFNGTLDDFYVYSRAISAAEVLQLYNVTPCQMPVFGNTLVCANTFNTYSVAPISNGSYTWSLPGGWVGSSTTNTISIFAGSSPATISVAVSSTCGTVGVSTLAISTLSLPPLSISSQPAVLCNGSSATLTALGAVTYTWLPGGSNTSTMLVSSSGNTTFTVSAKGTNSCVQRAIYTALVASGPTLSVLKPPALCNGAPMSFTATGADTYTWQPGNLTGSLVSVAPTTSTNYTVTGTGLNSCTANAVSQVTVPSVIVVTVSASSPTSCPGQSVTVGAAASGGTGMLTFNWTGGPASATNVVHENTAGIYVYTVTVTDANNCSASHTISVNFISTVTLSSQSTAICYGSVETLTVTGAGSYTWYPGAVPGNTYAAGPVSATEYTVIGTSAQGCTASAIQTVTIKPAPTLSFNTSTITCGSLGSATVTASGTPGPFSFSWTPTSQLAPVANNLYPGVYTVTVFDAGNNCTFAPTTTFTPLVPLTGTVTATNSLLCNGANTGSASIALSGGSGSQNYLWTDSNGTSTLSNPTSLAAGINTVHVIDDLTYCHVTHTFLITQPSAFTLNIAASSPSVCMGGSITYTALNSGGTPGYTYTWTNGTTSSITTITESSPSVYVYTIASTDANSCVYTKTVSGKFVANPTVNLASVQICPLATATLLASGATTYSWNNGSSANPLMISPPSTTQFTVVGSAAGCTASAVGDVTVKPAPTVSFTSNSPVCEGDSLVFSSVNTHSLYNWSGPSGFTSTLSSVTRYNVLPSQAGNYSLKVTAANSCTASLNKLLTVNPTPSLSASAGTVCEGNTLHLSSNFLIGGTYVWSGPAYTSTLQNPSLPASNVSMTGNYSVMLTSAQGCTNLATVSASVIASPVPLIQSNPDFCIGSSLSLNGSGGTSYAWFGPNSFNSTFQNPVIPNAGLSAGGIYTLVVYSGSCHATTYKSITANALPTLTASSNNPVCLNTSVNFAATSGAALTYSWSGPGNFSSGLQNPVISSAAANSAGNYTVVGTDANFCSGKAYVSIITLQVPLLTASDVTACIGSPVTFSASGSANYAWSGPQNFSSAQQVNTLSQVTSQNAGVYTVTSVGNNSCTSSAFVNVSGLALPLPVPVIAGVSRLCLNDRLELHGFGGTEYLWQGPDKFVSSAKDLSVTLTSFNMAGIYSLTLKNESNCVATSTIFIRVNPLPQGSLISSKNNLCIPFCTALSFQKANKDDKMKNYAFAINATNSKDSVQNFCLDKAGTYVGRVVFTDTNDCVNTSTLLITAIAKPDANFEFKPAEPIAGIDDVQFLNTTYGEGLGTWEWYLQKSDTAYTKEKNASYFYQVAGQYPVVLVAKNKWGCQDTVIKVLVVEDEFHVFVPDAFTPNGDGLNELFMPKGQGVLKYNLEVYTRWGQQVFETKDFLTGWDGTFQGKLCKADVYVWKITVTTDQKENKKLMGHVSLIRGSLKEEE